MIKTDMKEVLEEVKLLREKLERLEGLVEERLVGCEPPLPDEVEAITEYEVAKKKKTWNLMTLKHARKGLGFLMLRETDSEQNKW